MNPTVRSLISVVRETGFVCVKKMQDGCRQKVFQELKDLKIDDITAYYNENEVILKLNNKTVPTFLV